MKNRLLIAVVFALLSLVTIPASAQMDAAFVTHENRQRAYYVYTPTGYDGSTPIPLVLVLHASGGSAESIARLTGFNSIAEREGFLAIYPIGPYGYWDYGAGLGNWTQVDGVLDDPGYVTSVLDQVTAEYNVDSARIYAVGFSNGARMAYRLGCDLGNRLAAIAAVAATISDEITGNCPDESYVSVLFVHGTGDHVIPWHGKPLHIGEIFISTALSAPATAAFWAEHNQCANEPESEALPDSDPNDQFSIRRDTYAGCEFETEVVFYRMINGGHEWFRRDDFDTTETVWSFFLSHPRYAGHH